MWETVDEIMIGAEGDGVAGMIKVSELGINPSTYTPSISKGAFTIDPVHFATVIRRGDGSEIEQGWRQAAWHINFLRDSQYDALAVYKIAVTTPLYIRTLSEDSKTWKNYLVKSLWPPKIARTDPTAIENGIIVDFMIRFIQMVEQS